MAIYTKTGDCGMTSLVGGKRVSKCCVRLEAYGTVDELNSNMGLLHALCCDETARNVIVDCQNVLFDIGARLATEDGDVDNEGELLVQALERSIDEFQRVLPPWRGFTLPGGVQSAAQAHVCRTVCRRAERCILRLGNEARVAAWILQYINRLSDLLYVIALRENMLHGKQEVIWRK
ncbi:MAG: cob(I)yrinic acid a,c-diamide adenosyltransferase [Bacteroidaceae bacterium]|nr:cob(I)yrinic acid a,c-diamide adenosyltransferase [Bacteroidaceae bacterium]